MNNLDISTLSQLSIKETLINFVVALILSIVLRYCYKEFGKSSSNRDYISYIFPLITMTTFLIIVVVKSSLALSLGLVGALSIVRFRTPIKEPETLGYFFLSIGIGLGLGAERRMITVIIVLLIIGFYAASALFKRKKQISNLFLNLILPAPSSEFSITDLNNTLSELTKKLDLRRYDRQEDQLQVTYLIDLKNRDHLDQISKKLQVLFPKASITFVDNNNLLLG